MKGASFMMSKNQKKSAQACMEWRKCARCGTRKTLQNYQKNASCKDGFAITCKQCSRAAGNQRVAKKKARFIENEAVFIARRERVMP